LKFVDSKLFVMDLEWRNLFTRIELVGKPEKLTEDYHEDVHNIIHVKFEEKIRRGTPV
jgi:hypothetical protein